MKSFTSTEDMAPGLGTHHVASIARALSCHLPERYLVVQVVEARSRGVYCAAASNVERTTPLRVPMGAMFLSSSTVSIQI